MDELLQMERGQTHPRDLAGGGADSFHRLAKSLLDSGESASVEDALEVFSRFGVRLRLPPRLVDDPVAQVIALTAINAASRSFQGNVLVEGEDSQLTVHGFEHTRLSQFLEWVGIRSTFPEVSSAWPIISVGESSSDVGVHAWACGWQFGIGKASCANGPMFAPACIAAGGLAVSEAFSILRKDNAYAGRRALSLSLWDPIEGKAKTADQPSLAMEALWLVGLGHLGQAYAWGLGFIEPGEAPIVLQDVDHVTESTLSTSMISTRNDIGSRKTRVAMRWLESRGYQTALVERRFDEFQRLAPTEPGLALFGVDNAAARRVMEGAGFRTIIDAGLGSGYNDFRGLRMRTFPGPATAAQIWAHSMEPDGGALAPAYERMLREGKDPCGVTTLASRAVGAPFVGCVAAGYVLAERVRRQMGEAGLAFLDVNLRDPARIVAGNRETSRKGES
jgi:hypothetical protein